MCRADKSTTKISMRISGGSNNTNKDMLDILSTIINRVGGEYGGHKNAAGAIIKTADEDSFIKEAKIVIENLKN